MAEHTATSWPGGSGDIACVDCAAWSVGTTKEQAPRYYARGSIGTDRAGFEPAVELAPYAGLANRYLQPLGHLSRERRSVSSSPLDGPIRV